MQPLIPIGLDADWNPIPRTNVPVIGRRDVFQGAGSQSGVGDGLLSRSTPTMRSSGANAEATRDRERGTWSVPLNLLAAKRLDVGGLKVSPDGGVGYRPDSPQGGPHGWRVRVTAILPFPR